MSDLVVVTGLGVIGAFGGGREALAAALLAAQPSWREVDLGAGYHLPGSARHAALIENCDLARWVPPREARRMSPPSKIALAAARMAVTDAGLGGDPSLHSAAVAVATAFGPSSFTEGLLRQILFEGPEAASPFLFTESVANAPAAQIGIALGAHGAGITIAQREAGALLTLARGAAEIEAGRAPVALAGVVEEMTPLLHAVLDRFGALSRDDVARPFDRRRSGFVAGEGSSIAVLETAAAARARGRRPLAQVVACCRAFDPSAPPAGWGTGDRTLSRALAAGLARAGIAVEDIGLIVSGASGSPAGDRLEALTLRAVWGDRPLPPVLAPKAVTGEYGGGFLGAALLAASGASFGPTPGFAEIDPELGISPHAGGPLPATRRILVSTLAAGGAAVWLVLGSSTSLPEQGAP